MSHSYSFIRLSLLLKTNENIMMMLFEEQVYFFKDSINRFFLLTTTPNTTFPTTSGTLSVALTNQIPKLQENIHKLMWSFIYQKYAGTKIPLSYISSVL